MSRLRELAFLGWAAWAPGIETEATWREWVCTGATMPQGDSAPPLSHLGAMFKRRLSQLSRMTLHVGREALRGGGCGAIVFASRFGEVGQQFKITRVLCDADEVSPAAFSLSVFNAPASLLSIAEGLTCPTEAIFAGDDAFPVGFLEAQSRVVAGDGPVLLILADEALPELYRPISDPPYGAWALALLLGADEGKGGAFGRIQSRIEPPSDAHGAGAMGPEAVHRALPDALQFLRWALGAKSEDLSLDASFGRLVFSR